MTAQRASASAPADSTGRDGRAPVLVAGVRSAIGTAGHAFAELSVMDLAAPVVDGLARRAADLGCVIDDIMIGNCLGPGGNVARSVALAAGLGAATPAVTVDRQCGSGLEAIRLAAHAVTAGAANLIVAGGAESASTAPWRFWPPDRAAPVRYTRAPFAPPGWPDPDMGPAADTLAAVRGISRARQDAYAKRSHDRAVAAAAAGRFDDEIIAVQGMSIDQRPRRLTAERLAALRPAFSPEGSVTAGNASGISDGAAMVAVTTRELADAAGMPWWRIVSTAAVAGDPALPGAGAGPAARAALTRAGLAADDVGALEVTEAFAAVALAFADELDIDDERLCRDGGAVALGHPWGASGAVLAVRLIHQMVGDGPEFGLAACAIGGGQGVAIVLQRGGAAR